jgi:hypothetical protein
LRHLLGPLPRNRADHVQIIQEDGPGAARQRLGHSPGDHAHRALEPRARQAAARDKYDMHRRLLGCRRRRRLAAPLQLQRGAQQVQQRALPAAAAAANQRAAGEREPRGLQRAPAAEVEARREPLAGGF